MASDKDLVQRAKNGERLAFSHLVRNHQKGLLRVVLRVTKDFSLAEEVVQEAFLKGYQKLHLFEGRASFKSWIYRIGLNTARNRLRSVKKESVDSQNVAMAINPNADKMVFHLDVQNLLQLEIERLPDKQKTALMLRIFEDLSFAEVAEIMECPYDTAKANYRHALLKLRSRVESNKAFDNWRSMISLEPDSFTTPLMEAEG